jgi:CBS-domain-containing membrane protein
MTTGTKVATLMTEKVATLGQGDTLDVADGIMSMGRIRHLPVLDGGKVVGVVSQRDLFRSALGAALAFGIQRPQELMKSVEIRDVMSAPAVTVAPGSSVQDAARTMAEKKIGCLPVVENGRLVGILTENDVLRYAMAH